MDLLMIPCESCLPDSEHGPVSTGLGGSIFYLRYFPTEVQRPSKNDITIHAPPVGVYSVLLVSGQLLVLLVHEF